MLTSEQIMARRHAVVRRVGVIAFVVFLGCAIAPITLFEVIVGVAWLRAFGLAAAALVLALLWPLAKDQSARLRRGGYAAVVLWVTLCVAIPWHPRVRFARDVGRLTIGMQRAKVDRLLSEHLGDRPPLRGSDKTFYEPIGGQDRCLVTWSDDRVASVDYYRD